MKKLFITDLDGTALGGDYEQYARFPDFFSEFLDSLVAQGHSWGINTTWDVGGQWDLVNISSVKSKPDYLMAEFGLRMASAGTEQPEFIQPYTQDMEDKLTEIQHRKLNPVIRDLCGKFDSSRMMFFGHLFSFELAKYESVDDFREYLQKYLDDKELICQAKLNTFSMRPAFLNKAEPLLALKKHKCLSPDQTIVAGDEVTDIAMMQPELAKHYICPANASSKVKDHVAKHNGEIGDLPYAAGVVQAFNRLSERYNWK